MRAGASDTAQRVAPTPRAAVPPEFASWRNRHLGETLLVCGCGESTGQLQGPVALTTIGVNDVGRRFTPSYLVVVNPESQFSHDRFEYIRNSGAAAVFTQYANLAVPADRRVLLRLGQYGGTDFTRSDIVHYTQNSPYVAVCIAVHMGARRIGLLGVDFGTRSLYGTDATHPLTRMVAGINAEYARLAAACAARGVEIFNLSPTSKLTSLPTMPLQTLLRSAAAQDRRTLEPVPQAPSPAVLVVDYDFLTCGRVFGDGLARGGASIGARVQTVLWSDPGLPELVERFQPDLIVVVHGRSFAQRWGDRFNGHNTAVWLLDEPYEVDDTARWSARYKTVFVNDRATLSRHRNAHYLPVCYDAETHRDKGGKRQYRVGFIGGSNTTRERYLTALASAGLLDYVVGGPWVSPALQKLSLAQKISPAQTTDLYRDTQIVINVYRDIHHFNHERIEATAPNPRILEALACGAIVVSERRVGADAMCPELPQFGTPQELVEQVRKCLTDESHLEALKLECGARIKGHAYSDRLATMLEVTLPAAAVRAEIQTHAPAAMLDAHLAPLAAAACVATQTPTAGGTAQARGSQLPGAAYDPLQTPLSPGWSNAGAQIAAGELASLVLTHPRRPGAQVAASEAGLVSDRSFDAVDLRFTARFSRDGALVAKIHQTLGDDPRSESYQLVATATGSYLACHEKVLGRLNLPPETWIRIRMRWMGHWLELWADDVLQARFRDNTLLRGYCFIGSRGGTVAVHSISLDEATPTRARVIPLPGIAGARGGAASASARSTGSATAGVVRDLESGLELPPLGEATRRNLIYHVWPKLESNWRWNIEQLLARIDRFNGKRVIGIVEDKGSEPAAAVMELLAGHGCEFLVKPNGPAGETLSFPGLLEKVASNAPDEVTFYGHAKGVKYGLPCPPNVHRWSEALYRALLDDWPTVRHHLSRFAMTGCFRMPGRVASHRNSGDWHYSGTFFWMRHAAVFAREWQKLQEFYYGVEAWPGSLFRKDETGCVLVDDLRPPLPYMDEFWRRRGSQALREWEATRRDVEIPPDLANPKPFDGLAAPRLEHKPEEFRWWLEQLKSHGIRRLLAIGSTGGAPEWHTARVFREAGLDLEITTIEPHPSADLQAAYQQAREQFGQRIQLLTGSPRDASLRAQLDGPFDAVLIDGNHGYDQVHADFLLARSLNPRLIGLHDIVDSDWHAKSGCCVSRLWRELVAEYRTQEKSSGVWAGIGVVLLPP